MNTTLGHDFLFGGPMQNFHFLLWSIFIFSTAHASILPENNLTIYVDEKSTGLTEAEYHQVIDKVEAAYREEIESKDIKFTINRLWEDPRVNAGTMRKKGEWIINLYGGYARHPKITPDGYALVICHELGHHMGGTPRKKINGTIAWPSVEGQADYFATSRCLKKVFKIEDHIATAARDEDFHPVVIEKCSSAYKSEYDKAACKRFISAGLAVSAISADIRRAVLPLIETPDPLIVDETFESHPMPQCRLDTYFQGSIQGPRPFCWYKPIE
jgi:hypothetical protein